MGKKSNIYLPRCHLELMVVPVITMHHNKPTGLVLLVGPNQLLVGQALIGFLFVGATGGCFDYSGQVATAEIETDSDLELKDLVRFGSWCSFSI